MKRPERGINFDAHLKTFDENGLTLKQRKVRGWLPVAMGRGSAGLVAGVQAGTGITL